MLVKDRICTTRAGAVFSLRRREKRDAPALFDLFDQPLCRRAMVLEPFKSVDDVQTWFDAHPPGGFELVATVDDQAIGFAGLQPCPGSQNHSAWLSLFIHDDYHHQGIGTLLMKAIIATAELLAGLTRVQLIVQSDNKTAIRLYRKFGFIIEGRHECFSRRDDNYIAAFTMARITEKLGIRPGSKMPMSESIRVLLSLFQTV